MWRNATTGALAELAGAQGSLRELANRLAQSPTSGGPRLAIVATSVDDLRAKLAKAKSALESKQALNDSQGIYLAFGPPAGKVAFLFPGQGSQKTGMLRDLSLYFPEFRASMEQAEQALAGRLPKKLSAYIYPPAAFGPEREKQQNLELTDTLVAQPALGVVEIGLCRALGRLGVHPDMTAGHSYGEYVALAAAGVISDSALFDLSESRGRAIKDTTREEAGTMAAVQADAETITKALAGMEGITLANHNSPRQTVISGANDAVRAAITKLEAAGLTARLIPVACAFHSPLMEPARSRFAEVLARQTFARPSAQVFSNTLGGPYPEEPREIAALLASHLVRPVKFVDEIRAMYEQGARVFVEVGPKGVLTGLARQILEGKAARFIQIDSDRSSPWAGLVQLLHTLAQLAVEGVAVEAAQLLRGRIGQAEPTLRDTGWMVNGLRAFPRSQPPQVVQQLNLVLPSAIPVPAPAPAPVAVPMAAPLPLPVAPAASFNGDAVMLQFQQLMKQILQTQTTIMTAYMQGGAPMPPLAMLAALPVAVPAAAIPAPSPESACPLAPSPARPVTTVEAPPTPAPALRNILEDLRRIAAERTGYPTEMLDLDAAIESDLGIDSIKRVEILTALQKLGTPDQQQAVQAVLTQLTSARSLREIATICAAAAPAPSAPAPAAPVPTAVSPGRDFIAELRQIAAERTGYPPEMLDLDAGIEADLGIDSIKRVEILTGLQKLGTPEEQERMQGVMNQLTSARTLREIAGVLAAGAPAPSIAAPAAPAPPTAAPAPPAAAPAPAASGRNYIAELVKISSERTGYEPDMLDLDAGIEADLGIDSIKRVEILTALQQLLTPAEQTQIQGVMEKLTSARTLREMADRIASELGGEVTPPLKTTEPSGQAQAVPRYILTATSQPRRPSKPQYFPGRISLITDDETGIAAAVADELNRAGEHALLLRHSPDATIEDGEVFGADLTDPTDIESLVSTIRRQYGQPIGAVIHLLPLRSSQSAAQANFAEWRELLRLDVRSLYALARATESDLKQTGRAGGALFAAVTARGGDFGLRPNAAVPPTHFSVADFTKTLSLEFTGVLCKVVDLDATDPIVILHKKLLEELTSPDDTLQVGLPGDRRLTVMPQIAPVDGPVVRQIQRDWVFLLTGGARGVTAEIARQLAEHYQPTLILAAASPLPSGPEPADTAGITETARLKAILLARLRASSTTAVKPAAVEAALQRLLKDREIHQTIENLRRAGARVEYHSLVVRREDSFGGLIDRIYRDHGRLDVVIHGAGIIEDKLIRDKTPESFDRVVHTKADSAFVLSRKLRPESLQCLLFMSSVTAAFGNRGQADYAAANGAMNGLAINLAAQWPARVVAMNWGPWAQSGMVSEEVRQQFLARGIQMIPLEGGAQAALREIEAGPKNEAIAALGEGPWGEVALPSGMSPVQAHAYRSRT